MIYRETATFKRTYAEDMALYRVPLSRYTVAALAVLGFVIFPWWASDYALNLANLIIIACLGAVGLNLLTGYCGQISMGHAAFMSVGAYTAAVLSLKFGVGWWLALPAGGVMAALLGAFIGIPSLRIKGLYLAVATLAAQLLIEWTINHVTWISGGTQATLYVSKPVVFGLQLKSNLQMYYFILVIAVGGTVFALNLLRTQLGRSFVAVRDRDVAAEIIGVNLFRTKLSAFAVSSFYAGITGVLYTYYYGMASYEAFTLNVSIEFLAMIIIGGLGSILGSIFGAIFVTLLPIVLERVLQTLGAVLLGLDTQNLIATSSSLKVTIFGALIMLFLVLEPDGLNRMWNNIKDYFKVWPFPYQ